MKNKTFAKAVSAIVAISTMVCATTVNSSALYIKDAFCIGQKCNTSIAQIVQCLRSGNCNVIDLITGKKDCVTGSCENVSDAGCAGGNCTQSPAQTGVDNTTTPVAPATKSDVQTVFELVNKERKAIGLSAVTLSNELCKTADVRAKEIVKSFSHTRPNGTTCFTVFKENGITYRYAGENIAYGQKTATIVMNAWMSSSGHRANILNKNFGKIGIACYEYGGKKYWVQLFTN